MIDISVNGVDLFFGDTQILKQVTFSIYEGQKVGLIGKNGAGKTTLFKVISGVYTPDAGGVSIPAFKRVGILDQIPVYRDGMTVLDVLEIGFDEIYKIKNQIDKTTDELAKKPEDTALFKQLGDLQTVYEDRGGYLTEIEINKVCNGLGIDAEMRAREFNVLSGGEQTRVNLARMILMKTDILLLDEPTNHLDLNAVEWLEEYLRAYRGTLLTISHDRFFLDRTVNRIIEIENMSAQVYEGNYSYFAAEKEAALIRRQTMYEQETKEINRLTETARMMRQHGTEKLIKRAKSIEKRIERIRTTERVYKEKSMTAGFSNADRSGNDVLSIKSLSKAYGNKKLFENLELGIKKDEAVALIGENGTGKTTLVKILLGDETQDCGRYEWGANIKPAYLPQHVEFDNEHRTVVRTVMDELNMSESSARNRLGSYHFHGDEVFLPLNALSGGERSRLRLCIMMFREVNTLILDEPTNHLDIASREWIEDRLEKYEGTMLFISHDRYFIDRFATRIWNLADGGVENFEGTYGKYREKKETQKQPPERSVPKPEVSGEAQKVYTKDTDKRLVIIDRDLRKLESRLMEIDIEMDGNSSDYEKLNELIHEKETVHREIEELYDELNHIIG